MSRTILLADSFYHSVLESEGLERFDPGMSYQEALEKALQVGFGTGAVYRRELENLGWHSVISILNAGGLQASWAVEHGVRRPIGGGWRYGPHIGRIPVLSDLAHRVPHLHGTFLAQVERLAPDVVMVQDLNLIPPALGRAIRRHTRLLVGEIASPLPPRRFFAPYDLIVSALPSIVDAVRSWGTEAESIPLGFDGQREGSGLASARAIEAIFVGSFSRHQPSTAPLLRAVADRVPGLRIYGTTSEKVLRDAGLAEFYHGPAWGDAMFSLLADSKLVINRHGSIAGPYAVNMRMFEATGSGAVLVTEAKSNLEEFFVPGDEVLAYTSIEEAAQMSADILNDPQRLDRVAAAGRARTLGHHTYAQRAQRLVDILESRLH